MKRPMIVAATLLCLAPFAGCAHPVPYQGGNSAGDPGPWTVLFNGKDLEGWKPFLPDASADPAKTWFVRDTILCCAGTPVGYIATTKEYTDFELEVDWRFDPAKGAGNSGVLLRVQKKDEVWPKSMEAQLQSGRAGDIWNIGNFGNKWCKWHIGNIWHKWYNRYGWLNWYSRYVWC